MALDTDFNVPPYFDDFDPKKKFYRILFKPTYAVQARELTQSQTILQNQIERFGNHVFRNGSIVEGCNPTIYPKQKFVYVDDTFVLNANAYINSVSNSDMLVGSVSNLRAVVLTSKDGRISQYPNTSRYYINYLNTGANNETAFLSGETLLVYNGNQGKFANLDSNNIINSINVFSANSVAQTAVGEGYAFRVEGGIIYNDGFFQYVDDQIVIVSDFDQNVGNKAIGFDSYEEIVNWSTDPSLLDNALGYPNENAQGADRLKLTPYLVVRDKGTITANDTFFSVFEFSNINGELILNQQQSPYDNLGDIIDQRTYEESGDYVVKPFQIETVEAQSGNSLAFDYQLTTGLAYVHGSRVEYLAPRSVEAPRAATTAESQNQIITTNYGNYVVANQVGGAFAFRNYHEVDLYDAPFYAIDFRLQPSFVGKTKVGAAKVIQVINDDGNPGLPATTYDIYLTDIQMLPGYSFGTDAKSIFGNGAPYGIPNAFADFANTTSTASIQTTGASTLVFPFSKKALKTLRSANGAINDTNFYFRESNTAILKTDGTFAVTIPTSHAGGKDQVGYSLGPLGDGIENQFVVTLNNDATTANLAFTVATSGTTLTGPAGGPYLNAIFGVGDYVAIYLSPSVIDYRRIVSFTNAYTLTVDAAFSSAATGLNIARFFPRSSLINFDSALPGDRSITVTGDTTFVGSVGLNVAAALTAQANVTVQYPAFRTQATQAAKDVRKDVYVCIDTSNNATTSKNYWNLGLPDVFNIKSVYLANSYTTDTQYDATKYFTFNNGQQAYFYDHSFLSLKPQYRGMIQSDTKLTVVLDFFEPNFNNGVGFFSVDSYPTTNGTANSTTINWIDIPQFSYGGITYDLRDSVDFRGVKRLTAAVANGISTATVNPGATDLFITDSTSYLATPNENFEADIEYYLGRIDLITLNTKGALGVAQGTPSLEPKSPTLDTDVMLIAVANVQPFPSLTAREANSTRRTDYSTKTTIRTNNGYTMKDIGLLDQRIQRLEYYQTLSLLEAKASNIQVPDAAGINRFKNGIFADPQNSHAFGQTNSEEYRWCIDAAQGCGRPLHYDENVDLTLLAANSGVVQTGRYLTLPYTHELFTSQPYATKYRNNTQDQWQWSGAMTLYPGYDMNRDETRLPNIDATIDLTQPFADFGDFLDDYYGGTIFGTRYGDWRTTSITNQWSQRVPPWVTTFGDINQQRTITDAFITPISRTIDLGKYITDISVQPFMKSRTIAVFARSLKPNGRVYAFFDQQPVSAYCAPAVFDYSLGSDINAIIAAAAATGKPDACMKRTGNYGDPLVADSEGRVYAIFMLPEGKFRTGDRVFQLADVDSLVTGEDAIQTKATATFTASNISISSRNATITTLSPQFETSSYEENRTLYQEVISRRWDPLAQSFELDSPSGESGMFVTKVDLFFHSKDPSMGMDFYLCGLTNGLPDSTQILGHSYLPSSSINVSNDASAATTFVLEQPVFLQQGTFYAFYIVPEGGSPEYTMWMAEVGGTDVVTGAQVFANPYAGDAFRSSNAKTWTPITTEDIKFNMHVANFNVGSATAFFTNENDEYINFTNLALANSSSQIMLGDECWVVNSSTNAAVANLTTTGIIQFFDNTNDRIKLDSSTGWFAANQTIGVFRVPQQGNVQLATANNLIATFNIETLRNPALHAIVPRFATMEPYGTAIDISFSGMSNSYVIDGSYYDLSLDNEREMYDQERIVLSYSNELVQKTGKTLAVSAVLRNSDKYLSPVIDLSRKAALCVQNIVSANNLNEVATWGAATTKYVTQPIVLADGQDSEDLRVYITGYRPINTDIEVYARLLSAEDSAPLNTKSWTKMVNTNEGLRSSSLNPYDWKEYVFQLPTSIDATRYNTDANTAPLVNYTAWTNSANENIVQYTDENGSTFITYKQFSIKVVLLSEDPILVPKLNDIRGIALQV